MPPANAIQPSKGARWTGRILTGLVVLFCLLDGLGKFLKPQPVIDAFAHLGIPASLSLPIGTLLAICTIIYAIPQTSILGAILLTGFLGGAISIHLRAGDPTFPIIFPAIFAILAWLALYLRNPSLRNLIPLRR